ncbi:signal peptide peptidase SppA [Anaerolineales bacterium]
MKKEAARIASIGLAVIAAKQVEAWIKWERERGKKLDYVQFTLPQTFITTPDQTKWYLRLLVKNEPVSLLDLEEAFDKLSKKPIKGIILILRGFNQPFADLQSLRDLILKFKKSGKEVICYAQQFDMLTYYIASAGTKILAMPGASVYATGMRMEQTYLRDALDTIGVEMDVVRISPFKGALDSLLYSEPTESGRNQMEWLLGSFYDTVMEGIATERGIELEALKALVDAAPYTDTQAVEKGLIDHVVNEEGFPAYLGSKLIETWTQVSKRFAPFIDIDLEIGTMPQQEPDDSVAILYTSGQIINGKSENPPVDLPIPFAGGPSIGDLTVVQQIRNLMQAEHVKALVLYVDSPGGSATASEAIASALDELAKRIPIVVYMGNVAASGGYYISTPAQWIVAQPGTITGSIGVIMAKLITSGLYQKIKFNPVAYTRGENADLFSSQQGFTDSQRAFMEDEIKRIYGLFVERVAKSRKMSFEEVDAIGGGRVWTGAQALENGLVDELGNLNTAIAKARQLAKLDADARIEWVSHKTDPLPAQLADRVNPAASWKFLNQRFDHLNGQSMLLMPYTFNID